MHVCVMKRARPRAQGTMCAGWRATPSRLFSDVAGTPPRIEGRHAPHGARPPPLVSAVGAWHGHARAPPASRYAAARPAGGALRARRPDGPLGMSLRSRSRSQLRGPGEKRPGQPGEVLGITSEVRKKFGISRCILTYRERIERFGSFRYRGGPGLPAARAGSGRTRAPSATLRATG